ncbi:MAG: beta galactosidase jelly roll domain-containing protein [Bacteroidota bacterium]
MNLISTYIKAPFLFRILLLVSLCSISLQTVQADDWVRIADLNGKWKFTIGDNEEWAAKEFDDSYWDKINAPEMWEHQGFHGYNGFAWYRKKVYIPKNLISRDLYLVLGYIDDVDEVYLNGELIGRSGSFPPQYTTAYRALRKYPIPLELLQPGKECVIAVRVYDSHQQGGMVSGDLGIFATRMNIVPALDLRGLWKFKKGNSYNWKDTDYSDKNWDEIMVPDPWEHQGYWKYDGLAWYRKTFVFPENMDTRNLAVVIGKIDDFDQVYLNGEYIGSTNDGRPYGRSQSYNQMRVYLIPEEFLRKGEPNVISVKVKDIGNIGGIYEGPIGLFYTKDL